MSELVTHYPCGHRGIPDSTGEKRKGRETERERDASTATRECSVKSDVEPEERGVDVCLTSWLWTWTYIRGQSELSRTRHWNKIPRLHPLPSNIEEKITKCTFFNVNFSNAGKEAELENPERCINNQAAGSGKRAFTQSSFWCVWAQYCAVA